MHAHISISDHQSAARVLGRARDALLASGAQVSPHIEIPFAGGQVAAFRHHGRIRYEVIDRSGEFASHTFAGAARVIAARIAASFG